jgi:ABC transporter DrrB family efflux protein
MTVTSIAALPVRAPLPRPDHAAGALTTSLGIARRSLLQAVRAPQLLVTGLVRGAMFLLIFHYVFGGAIASGLRYVDFLVPGFLAVGILFSMMSSATAIAVDDEEGLFDRLRSLPVPRVAVVAGRVLADTGLAGLGLAVTAGVGFAIGFRTSAPLVDLVAAGGLCLLAAFAFAWVFVTLGLVAGSPQAAHGIALLVFPFTFVSSAFVPVTSMPGWMQAFAAHQPVTALVDAVRALALGDGAAAALGASGGAGVAEAVLWCAAITVVFAPLAASRFDRG